MGHKIKGGCQTLGRSSQSSKFRQEGIRVQFRRLVRKGGAGDSGGACLKDRENGPFTESFEPAYHGL